ncbi:Class I SAM-dependent methyltransferase [Rhodovastum atsumiense]|uniref:Class I SAM-dependent methyltransferase n=1 Tax=Rhodovastum atsumiense TaxID=504468 RepID=A0A5M6IUH5_9PROT|nr:class I SAM-dependent methyltransferase [Rhodovastum atsumiense]KAA5611973.1 class I SAM-dependent methyltransferase [Rhodovastum atsumiense]CAH2598752.1 Class I SAM-dependent methyltransferase [Rhodovastum atsumiense]
MPDDIQTFPGRFRGPAKFYTGGRPDYPPRLLARVATLVGGLERGRVLDLGTGPGFLALGFAPHAAEVIGIDPEPAMLAEAERNAAAAGRRIVWRAGTAETLDPALAPVRLVTIGRAFHWMDRSATLARLDLVVEAGGAVALFDTLQPNLIANAWHAAFNAVVERYGAADPARGHLAAASDHDAVLLASAFRHIERISVLEQRHTPVERLVDRAYSFAKTWGGQLDTPPQGLAEDVRAALRPYAVDGHVSEILEGHATLAWRPDELG